MALVLQNEGYMYVCNISAILINVPYPAAPEVDLSPGMKETIVTTNVPEKRCVLEAYQVLDEVRVLP